MHCSFWVYSLVEVVFAHYGPHVKKIGCIYSFVSVFNECVRMGEPDLASAHHLLRDIWYELFQSSCKHYVIA